MVAIEISTPHSYSISIRLRTVGLYVHRFVTGHLCPRRTDARVDRNNSRTPNNEYNTERNNLQSILAE